MIGKWSCYGSFVGQGAATGAGVWVYTTQVYEFNVEKLDENVNAPGRTLFVSHGPERIDEDEPWYRAVTGGAGQFRRAADEVRQTKVGFKQTECENFTFDVKLDGVGRPHRGGHGRY